MNTKCAIILGALCFLTGGTVADLANGDSRLSSLEGAFSELSRQVIDLSRATEQLNVDLVNHQHPPHPQLPEINHHFHGRNDCCLLDIARDQCKKQVAAVNLCKLGGRVYYFSPALPATTWRTWFEAQDFCRQRGLQLASLETWTENSLVKSKVDSLLNAMPPAVQKTGSYWVSLNDQNQNTVYTWAGVGTPAWGPPADWHTAPGIWSNSASEQCGALFKHLQFGTHWDDQACLLKNRFVCELTGPCLDLVEVNVNC